MFGQWGSVLRSPGVPLVYSLRLTAWLGRTMLMPFLPLFVGVLMVDSELTGIYTGVAIGSASLAGTLSGVVLGRLGDRIGHKRVLVTSAIVTAASTSPWRSSPLGN